MKLLFDTNNPNKNLLPHNGEAHYYEQISKDLNPQILFNQLLNAIQWEHDQVNLFGKKIITKRKVALYANKTSTYTYSNQQKQTYPWIKELLVVKDMVEELTEEQFNCCLCNLYHDGSEGMGWHTDNEKDLTQGATIASLSLGAERYFHFKHQRTKEVLKFKLESGSLLLMKGETQEHWLHALPKTKKIVTPRINLTFRSLANI